MPAARPACRRRGGWLAVALATLALATVAPAETRLDIPEARKLAVVLVQAGQAEAAREVARVLLQRDPEDVTALIVLARAERDLGAFDTAQAAGRRAYRLSAPGVERFTAAMTTAQALSSDGRRTRAQLWLRRAAEAAPDEARRRAAMRDFAYVRSRNPLTLHFGFGLAPSSNVNGGPTTNTLVIGGLEFVDPEAVPLSGLVATLDLGAGYVVDIRPGQTLTFGLRGRIQQIALTDDARDSVPDVEGSDFAKDSLSAQVGWALTPPDGRSRTMVDLDVGREWSGRDPLADRVALSLRHEQVLSPRDKLGFTLTGDHTTRLDSELRSSDGLQAGIDWTHVLPSRDRAGVSLTLGRVMSDAASVAHRSADLRISYVRGEPVLGMALSGYLQVGRREDERPLYTADPREDTSLELGVTATMLKLDYLGFAPEVGLVRSRTWSSVNLNDTSETQIRLGIRSSF